MRGRLLLAAALLLVASNRGGADEEPRADAGGPEPEVVRFFLMLQRVEATPRPAGRRPDAWLVAEFTQGATRFEAVLDGSDPDVNTALVAAMCGRGWRLEQVFAWQAAEPTPAERDAAALVAGDGKLPEGYVPAGRAAPGEIPPLPVLGGTVVLEIVGGEPRARVTAAPEGSRARKIGLREGDLILEVGGKGVGPLVLAALNESPPAGGQHTLRVRRTHGGIEQIEIDSWVGLPSR